jgi:hypothetical protein
MLTKEGPAMIYHNESKFQGWRAVAVFADGTGCLLYVGRSTAHVRAGYGAACAEVLDAEQHAHVLRVALQCWQGAADQGRWIAKGELPLPERQEVAALA